MASPPTLYLAGPDVFEPSAESRFSAMKAICRKYGMLGLSPLDSGVEIRNDKESALAIFDWNRSLIGECDAVAANLTPFRGPSADVGTALEVGLALALGKPVFGYCRTAAPYHHKVGQDGFAVEDFGLFDNLMLIGAVERSGGALLLGEEHPASLAPGGPLDLFEQAVIAASRRFSVRAAASPAGHALA